MFDIVRDFRFIDISKINFCTVALPLKRRKMHKINFMLNGTQFAVIQCYCKQYAEARKKYHHIN